MKLSSLMASILLGGSIILFSGCSADPDAAAEKIVEDILSEASVYSILLVNGTDAEVEFQSVSQEVEKQKVSSKKDNSFAFNGATDISYPSGDTVHYNKGKSGIYVATTCNGLTALHDTEDINALHIVNLTGADFSEGSVLIKETNTSAEVSGSVYQDCKINSTPYFNSITFSLDTLISVDAGLHYKTVRQMDPTFVNFGEKMKYYLVAYDDENLSFLPVVKADLTTLSVKP